MLRIWCIVFTDSHCTAHLDMGWNKLTGSIPESMIALPLSKCLSFCLRRIGTHSSNLSQSSYSCRIDPAGEKCFDWLASYWFRRDRANWYVYVQVNCSWPFRRAFSHICCRLHGHSFHQCHWIHFYSGLFCPKQYHISIHSL
jgi:hypothetical protein